MMMGTEPADVERSAVVVVMAVGGGSTARFARLPFDQPTPYVGTQIGPGVVFDSLFAGQGMGFTPLPHIGVAARLTVRFEDGQFAAPGAMFHVYHRRWAFRITVPAEDYQSV